MTYSLPVYVFIPMAKNTYHGKVKPGFTGTVQSIFNAEYSIGIK